MKCKEHPYEPGIGVCPSCLRERLLALIAAQNELSAANQHQHRRRRSAQSELSAAVPPPLAFPRSVSPYVAHRRSVGSDASPARLRQHVHQRFFSTPQVGPTFDAAAGGDFGNGGGRRAEAGRFSVLRMLFGRHRSEMPSDSGSSKGSGSSSSWFSSLIPRRRKNKKSHHYPAPEEAPPAPAEWRSSWRASDKGMSPTMEDYVDGESGYSTESPGAWRRPTPTPMRRFPGNHHRSFGGVSGFSVCLSPLVRAGTNGRRSQAAAAAGGEAAVSGESASQLRHASVGGASLAPNRSRKLADFGRFK